MRKLILSTITALVLAGSTGVSAGIFFADQAHACASDAGCNRGR